VLSIDNTKVRDQQVSRLKKIRAERDQPAVDAALTALTKAAEHAKSTGFTITAESPNLLQLSVDAARLRATLGE
jgi:methylmalonyl-CoA mutase